MFTIRTRPDNISHAPIDAVRASKSAASCFKLRKLELFVVKGFVFMFIVQGLG